MSKPLVVVQLLPALNNGGVERGTVEVANYLSTQGVKSLVISSGGAMQQKLNENVEHINLPVGKKSLLVYKYIKILKQLFIDEKVSIVHARSRLPAWLAYLAIAKIKDNRPKFFTTIHGLYSIKRYSSIMARGDKVIAVSKTASEYVQNNYAKYLKIKPQIIYRGINKEEFPYNYEADVMWLHKWYEQHHQLVGHKTVLLPGRLTSLKGVKDLLVWLKSNENDAKLVLTANPENDLYAAKLYHWFKENKVANRVHWVGLQSSMAELYAVADVVVSTSTRPESFGRTVLESLAIGTPVVGYNHGGVAEILTKLFPQGKVEVQNQQQLADKINEILKKPPQVKPQNTFILENMLQQTHKLYQDALND